MKKLKKKSEKKSKKIVPVPIYVFADSEQKAEFKAKIKPCSHQLNCMKLFIVALFMIYQKAVKISNKFNESFLSYG